MMKFRTLLLPFLVLLSVVSCKKDETEKTYMEGEFIIESNMPRFVNPGAIYKISVSGVEAPDGTKVGYYYTHPITKRVDTTATYTFMIPDTLGTFAVVCTAYPVESSDIYYTSSTSVSFTVVDDEKTLSEILLKPDSGSAELYSRTYYTNPTADGEWICSNLSYIKRDASGNEVYGHSYADSPATQNILGAYYTWESSAYAELP